MNMLDNTSGAAGVDTSNIRLAAVIGAGSMGSGAARIAERLTRDGEPVPSLIAAASDGGFYANGKPLASTGEGFGKADPRQ